MDLKKYFKIEKAYVYFPFPVGWKNPNGSYLVFVKVANLFLAMPVCVALQFVAPLAICLLGKTSFKGRVS